jgi:hypothetical protein
MSEEIKKMLEVMIEIYDTRWRRDKKCIEIFRHEILRKPNGEPGYKWDIVIHSSGFFFPSSPAKLLYSFSVLS